ncbi:MAG: 1-acyl-sn-glycerol-3-phosphate acyltransferase [Bacteroidia bacterium]
MFWHFLRFFFNITIRTFYRRIEVKNSEVLRVDKPILIAMNHPNAFMDPIAFSLRTYPPKVKYLARGDAFKKGFVTYVLNSVGIVPIFRIQDAGKEGLKKNDETFRIVNELLGKNEKIIVFAEGLCIQERRLRPVKKGTARMVFGAMETLHDPDLLIVPVGVNYSNAEKFRSFLYYNIGEPIRARDHIQEYRENPGRAMTKLTQLIESKMKELVAHVNNKENDTLVEELQPIYKKQWIAEQGLDFFNLQHQQRYWEHITAGINAADLEQAEELSSLRKKVSDYSARLKKLKLRDHLIRSKGEEKEKNFFLITLAAILGFPFYLIGKALNYVPYKASELITKRTVKNIEFYSSVNAVAGSFLFLIWYGIELLTLWLIFHNWYCLLAYTLLKVLTGWFALYYSSFGRKVLGRIRLKMLSRRNKKEVQTLIEDRRSIINTLKNLPD